jgi:hypothetical protein
MDEGLRARLASRRGTRSVASREVPTTGGAPTVAHRQVLGEPREERIPALVADGFRQISQQPLALNELAKER